MYKFCIVIALFGVQFLAAQETNTASKTPAVKTTEIQPDSLTIKHQNDRLLLSRRVRQTERHYRNSENITENYVRRKRTSVRVQSEGDKKKQIDTIN